MSRRSQSRRLLQREAAYDVLGPLLLKGAKIAEKCEALGLGQGQVYKLQREMLQRWREFQAEEANLYVKQELVRLDAAEKEAWEGWRRSIGTHVKTKTGVGGEEGKGSWSTEEAEELAGDPRFLAVILQCHEKRVKLLGLTPEGPRTRFPGMPDGKQLQSDPREALRLKLMEMKRRIAAAAQITDAEIIPSKENDDATTVDGDSGASTIADNGKLVGQ